MATKMRYGWIPDKHDQRDLRVFHIAPPQVLPPMVDLRPLCPPVYNQGQIGSCTANAIAAAIEFDQKKQKCPDVVPSRLFIYFNERRLEGTISQDAGAMIRDGFKALAKWGYASETEWPYNESMFAVKPGSKVYADAAQARVQQYARVPQTKRDFQTCLAMGFPIVGGFTVYEPFESDEVARTGVVDMPKAGDALAGGHAILVVGYDDASQRLIVRNSWGPTWGQAGYFTVPYDYFLNPQLAQDFWMVKFVPACVVPKA